MPNIPFEIEPSDWLGDWDGFSREPANGLAVLVNTILRYAWLEPL